MIALSAQPNKNYIGIDVGGTSVKGVIINRDGEIIFETSTPITEKNGDALCEIIVKMVNETILSNGGYKAAFKGVGIGCPGLIDSKSGTVVFSGNLNLKYYPLARAVSEKLGMHVKLTNDANAAALGEAKFGAGKKFTDSILITLGTGVGGGVVAGGKLFEGGNSAGTEIGHTVIVEGGERCTCGRRGCLEGYASATALIKKTKEAMLLNSDSKMWQTYALDTVSGKTAFDYAEADETAKQVVDEYIRRLACGIVNFANVFRPQVVMLGGGVSNQKERLTKPLQEILNKEIFAGQTYAPVKVVTASLGNRAGAFGAAALWM